MASQGDGRAASIAKNGGHHQGSDGRLSSLRKERDEKRMLMEELFEQQQALMKRMATVQDELHELDDKIDAAEQQAIHCTAVTPEAPVSSAAVASAVNIYGDSVDDSDDDFEDMVLPETVKTERMAGGAVKSEHATKKVGAKRASSARRNSGNGSSSSHPREVQVLKLLRETFRIDSFRENQKAIIDATLEGNDVFVIMRTGGGKSLTYQLPALLEGQGPDRKITVVVSPLLSLIHDQEEQMNNFAAGSALSFTSNVPGGNTEHARRWGLVRDPDSGIVLILVTPERIHKSGKLRNELEKLYDTGRLGRFVVDECHCASQWGHDFRPDYTKLGVLKTHFPTVPMLAVTATASEAVRQDCLQLLNMSTSHRFFRSTFRRPNLTYSVAAKLDGKEKVVKQVAEFINSEHPGAAGIVYTFSRKEAEEVAGKLCDHGIIAEPYHSSVTGAAKDNVHRSWMRNETQVVVATIAFGLGINKPDGE